MSSLVGRRLWLVLLFSTSLLVCKLSLGSRSEGPPLENESETVTCPVESQNISARGCLPQLYPLCTFQENENGVEEIPKLFKSWNCQNAKKKKKKGDCKIVSWGFVFIYDDNIIGKARLKNTDKKFNVSTVLQVKVSKVSH